MGKDDATWLKIFYGFFGLLLAYIAYKAIYTLGVQLNWIDKYDHLFPVANNLAAFILGLLGLFWLQNSPSRREYHEATIGEVRKVTWPSIPDTKKMTVIVVIVVAIFSVILSIFDLLWYKALQLFLP
jgi:preprotein translocase SecE subunit